MKPGAKKTPHAQSVSQDISQSISLAYIHGYDDVEQKRLIAQAAYLAPEVYPGVDFTKCKRVLEIGCGVGAQTKILLKRFPKLSIDAVDLSASQLNQASHHLRREIKAGRVRLFQSDASKLEVLGSQKYDGAFICWFLEHVPNPELVLREAHSHLRRGARLYATEVFNRTFFHSPASAVIDDYWRIFNEQQLELGGDPNVGPKLGGFLKKAGFRKIEWEARSLPFDARDVAARRAFIDYFQDLMLSGAKSLRANKRAPQDVEALLRKEFTRFAKEPDSVIYLSYCRATARA